MKKITLKASIVISILLVLSGVSFVLYSSIKGLCEPKREYVEILDTAGIFTLDEQKEIIQRSKQFEIMYLRRATDLLIVFMSYNYKINVAYEQTVAYKKKGRKVYGVECYARDGTRIGYWYDSKHKPELLIKYLNDSMDKRKLSWQLYPNEIL